MLLRDLVQVIGHIVRVGKCPDDGLVNYNPTVTHSLAAHSEIKTGPTVRAQNTTHEFTTS